MAGLRQINNYYYARIWYYVDDKKKEKSIPLKTKNKDRAKELLEGIEQQEKAFKEGIISLDDIGIREPTDLKKYIDQFYNYLQVNDKSPETIELYKLALSTFEEIYEGEDIEILSNQDYTDFLSKMKERYPNNNTCNIRLKSIRAFLNWLSDTGRIEAVPFKIKKLPVKKKRPRYFSDQEMELILEEAKDNKGFYARIFLHWKTGLRLRELSDSYLDNGFIKTYEPEKNGVERSIPVDQETQKQYRVAKEWDVHPDSISRKFRKVLKKLDLYKTKHGDKRHFHNLRHTFAVRKYYKTRDIYRVKTLCGHSSVKTTEKYAQFDLAELDQDFNIDGENQKNNPPRRYDNPSRQEKTRNKANQSGRNFTQSINGVAYV